jgi:hypothetical protein
MMVLIFANIIYFFTKQATLVRRLIIPMSLNREPLYMLRLNTVDILELTSLDMLLLILQTLITF